MCVFVHVCLYVFVRVYMCALLCARVRVTVYVCTDALISFYLHCTQPVLPPAAAAVAAAAAAAGLQSLPPAPVAAKLVSTARQALLFFPKLASLNYAACGGEHVAVGVCNECSTLYFVR